MYLLQPCRLNYRQEPAPASAPRAWPVELILPDDDEPVAPPTSAPHADLPPLFGTHLPYDTTVNLRPFRGPGGGRKGSPVCSEVGSLLEGFALTRASRSKAYIKQIAGPWGHSGGASA